MENNRFLSSLLGQISLSGMLATVIIAFLLDDGITDKTFLIILMAAGPLSCILNRLFLLKEQSLSLIVAFNAVIFAAAEAGNIFTGGFETTGLALCSTASMAILVSMGAYVVIKPLKQSLIIKYFDFSILLILFFLLMVSIKGLAVILSIPGIISAIAALAASISFRMNRRTGTRDWIIISVILAVICILAWVIFSFAADPLGNGIAEAWNGILAGFKAVINAIGKFFIWLASLFSEEETYVPEMEMGQTEGLSGGTAEDEMFDASGYILALIIAVVIIGLVIAFIVFRKVKFGKKKKPSAGKVKIERERKSIGFGTGKLLSRIKQKLRIRQFMSENKNTAPVIFYTLIKYSKKTPMRLQPGETPDEFLEKIKNIFEKGSDCSLRMEELKKEVNKYFFSQENELKKFNGADELKKAVKKNLLFIEKR